MEPLADSKESISTENQEFLLGDGTMLPSQSPFIDPGLYTRKDGLALVHLSKDNFVPVYLRDFQGGHDGYAEGAVLNTRFGSFPHSTLIDIPWGAQVRASAVDTGSRGRKRKRGSAAQQGKPSDDIVDDGTSLAKGDEENQKRKRDPTDEGDKRIKIDPEEGTTVVEVDDGDELSQTTGQEQKKAKQAVTAKSGFIHILPPTPEIWTSSLPHRTQVVYTPDYSYILHRIRARPGTRLIEAGAGSGSFTHASARAVYNGQSSPDNERTGKVFSFEFHEQRFQKMQNELSAHGLDGLVEITHRDVYKDGFLVNGGSPEAEAVFLDLPAPWLALRHLSRQKRQDSHAMEGVETSEGAQEEKWVSPLNPKKSVHICTFSPCVEQVTRTVSEMRRLGWVNIEMVEIAHRKIQVYREKIGLSMVSERGMQQAPRDVTEAVTRLKEIEQKAKEHQARLFAEKDKGEEAANGGVEGDGYVGNGKQAGTKATEDTGPANPIKPWLQGRLITRTEPEVKSHTSYLVFAVLPREWTEEDEAAAEARWPCGAETQVIGRLDRASRKQQKRDMLNGRKKGRADEAGDKTKDD